MPQHINLLTRRRAIKSLVWLATRGLGLMLSVLVVWAVFSEVKLQQLRSDTQAVEHTVSSLRLELKQKRHDAGLEDAQALAQDTERMRLSLDEHRALMQLVNKGEVGSLLGHATFLQRLATTAQPGVWLHGVDVTLAGQRMNIAGTALSSAAVMHYAQALNQSFQGANVAFTSLEISKEEPLAVQGAAKSSQIKFRLY